MSKALYTGKGVSHFDYWSKTTEIHCSANIFDKDPVMTERFRIICSMCDLGVNPMQLVYGRVHGDLILAVQIMMSKDTSWDELELNERDRFIQVVDSIVNGDDAVLKDKYVVMFNQLLTTYPDVEVPNV